MSFVTVCTLAFSAGTEQQASGSGTAEGATSGQSPTTSNPIVVAPGAAVPNAVETPTALRRNRAISSDVAAQLAAAAPKFNPAPPKPLPSEEDVDLRDVDKPRNGIIRLPAMIVHEKPPPVLKERTISTKEGMKDIAMKRYLTETDKALNSFRIPFFSPLSSSGDTATEDRALTMYAEDERLKNMAELSDNARMVGATDKTAGKYVKRQVDQTFMRDDGEFDWKPIGR